MINVIDILADEGKWAKEQHFDRIYCRRRLWTVIDDVAYSYVLLCLRTDRKGPRVRTTHKRRRGIIWAARREGAADVAEVGCTPEVTSPLTRAHVYAYTTPAAARRRHRCLPALNTLNILHALHSPWLHYING